MNKHERLLNDWYKSIIEKALIRMQDAAGSEESYDGWINDTDWEIHYHLTQDITYTDGDWFTPPSAEVGSLSVSGTLTIYDAKDNEHKIEFEYQDNKLKVL